MTLYSVPRKAKFDFRHFHTGIFCTIIHKMCKEERETSKNKI